MIYIQYMSMLAMVMCTCLGGHQTNNVIHHRDQDQDHHHRHHQHHL
jgi:hypothetical protein